MPDSSRVRFKVFRKRYLTDALERDKQADPTRVRADWKTRRGYLRDYLHWLRPHRAAIAATFALALLASLLGLITPRATMYIVDVVIPKHDGRLLHWIGAGLVVVICGQVAIEISRKLSQGRLNVLVISALRRRMYRHLLRLPLHELSLIQTGGITTRLSGDVDSVSSLMQLAFITPGVALIKIVVTLAVLLYINWKMSVAALFLLPPVIGLNLFTIGRIRPIYRSMRRDRSEIDGRLVETFGGIRVVRAFGREASEAKGYALDHHTVGRKDTFANLVEALVGAGWGLVIPLSSVLVVWVGGTLALRGETTIGEIMAFNMYLLMLLNPVSIIVQSWGQTQQALAAMERVFDILRRPIDMPDRPTARLAPARVERIEFDHVEFAYRADQPVIRDFSLDVPGGGTVALVGPSGSGKTTITNLVARFYDPTRGAIRLNGVDLRDFELQSYRSLLGLVSQDVFLFDGTIAENIAFARPSAAPAEIESAARRANAHDFIVSFPDKYGTLIGERGVRLSGGQAQRLSIARALLADPAILIFDEATSNLDTESERLIQASMAELLSHRTTFMIAHRLSTVVHADLIVVMEHGRIVEVGTHVELMAAQGRYHEMVERQAGGLADDLESADWSAR